MKVTVIGADQIAEEQLREDKIKRDTEFVLDKLNKERNALDKAEREWQESGGYGTRSPITRHYNQVKLCELALKGLEQTCSYCQRRRNNIKLLCEKLKAESKIGFETISIERAIDIIESIY